MSEIVHYQSLHEVLATTKLKPRRLRFVLGRLALAASGIFLMMHGHQAQVNLNRIITGADMSTVYEECSRDSILNRLECKERLKRHFWNKIDNSESENVLSILIGGVAIIFSGSGLIRRPKT